MERAKYDNGIKRYARLIAFKLLTTLPVSRFMRADLFRKLGVDIEKGTVRIGKIHIDTLHPEDIHIGSGTAIADGCTLLTHYYDVHNLKEHAYWRGEIHIGRNCYVGSNTIFSKPVTIGDGAVIGAGSVVTKDIPPYQVWAGVPARFICNRFNDESEIPTDTSIFKPR
ncbi:MAG: acyltransferase [Alistipes sp.]|nr:acyltransferase [Alistipes sp.]